MKKINLDGHLAYFFLAFIATAGLSYMNYLPSMVNALAGGLGFSKVEAGQIVAFNGYGGLIGIALATFMVTKTNSRSTIIKALLILALVDLATTFVDEYFLMLGWRFLAGVIGGICVGLAFSAVAKTKNPDRGFGFLLFIQFSLGSLVIMLLPTLEFYVNANAVFYVMAGIVLASTFLQLLLPEPSSVKQQDSEVTSSSKLTREQLLLLLSITLYQVAASAIWAYIGLVGLEANHSAESVSTYIAVTGLLGLLGAMLPILRGNSFGRLKWVLTGVSFSAISAVLLIFSDNTLSYILSMALLFLSWPAVQSFLLAVSAELDESGKLSTIAALVTYLGLASGPLLASSILNVSGFTAMLLSCAVIFLISFALLLQPVQAQESTIKLTLLS